MKLVEHRTVDIEPEKAFAYTADFSNIQAWDPGVASSRRTDEGPLQVGSSFQLMVRFGRSTVPMTYEIAVLQPSSRVVLVGRGSSLEAVDDIRFSPTDGGTRIDYTADLTFRGVMRLVAPFLRRAMDRVGERALDGLAAALD